MPTMDQKTSQRTLLKWSLIGLAIRFLIMPFTMHTWDILFIYYFPYQGLKHGIFDIYHFIQQNFPDFHVPYYPPLAYFLTLGFLAILKFFLPQLDHFFGLFETWISTHGIGGGTIQYASLLANTQLYRTLFFLKIPYLMFDFGTAFLLFRLAKDLDKGVLCYQLWMLNPALLYDVYAVGQFDVIPVFLTTTALYAAVRNKKEWAVIFLSLGGLVKVYPAIFLPLFWILLGENMKERLKLLGVSLIPWMIVLIPLYISSNGYVLDSIFITHMLYNVTGGPIRKVLFIAGYACLLVSVVRGGAVVCAKRAPLVNVTYLNALILLVFLLYILVGLTKFRYLVWLSPFLILAIAQDQKLAWLGAALLVFLAEVHLSGNQVQWGLFDPICPTFFASLPIMDSFLVAFSFPLAMIHKVSYFLFLGTTVVIGYRVWKWRNSY